LSAAAWSRIVILTVAVIGGSFAAMNHYLDPMGVFHSKPHVSIYTNERWSKYLLSTRYVPENFDAVLVGTSATDNWNTGLILPLRTYNLSLEGGNASEARVLLENVIRRRRPKIVFFCIHPYLTASYGRQTPYMTKADYWSALGSLELLRTYQGELRVKRGTSQQEFNEFGQRFFNIPARPWHATFNGADWYRVDERSLADYGAMVANARASGARIVAVVPPVATEFWQLAGTAFQGYQRQLMPFFHEGDLVIDFNTPPYDSLRSDRANFPDGIHLTTSAADAFVRELARLVSR
jgi:hypothetical protein